jgi:predicted nucleic acid-binding protein
MPTRYLLDTNMASYIIKGDLDLMIAAHALAAQGVLVTNDRAFRRVRELKIEDWSKP